MKKDIVLPASFITLNKFVEDFKKRYKDWEKPHLYIFGSIIHIDLTASNKELQKEFKDLLRYLRKKELNITEI